MTKSEEMEEAGQRVEVQVTAILDAPFEFPFFLPLDLFRISCFGFRISFSLYLERMIRK